jgi:hypothetical protein
MLTFYAHLIVTSMAFAYIVGRGIKAFVELLARRG